MSSASSGLVALVTGANKGIGKEIARQLGGALPGITTVLACREDAKMGDDGGAAAATEIGRTGQRVVCCKMDLTDAASISAAGEFVQREFGRLDILVNNAAICFNDPTLYGKVPHHSFQQQADITIRTNFFGTLAVTRTFLPLLRQAPSPRLITVASAAGRLSILKTQEKRDAFASPAVKQEQVEQLMQQFVRDVEAGVHQQHGWPNTCYGTSKLGLISLMKALARDEPKIMVNLIDPGYCKTDQNNNQGPTPPAQGARTAIALASLPSAEFVSGKYFHEGREIAW